MKKTIISSMLILIPFLVMKAQDPEFQYYKNKEIKTLLGTDRSGGAYGSFSIGYSYIDKQQAVLLGGRFSWIASHYLAFGVGGTGFINEYHNEPNIGKVFLTGGYGGIYLEPILFPRFPVHLSFPLLLGAGGISYVSKDPVLSNNFIEDSKAFLLIEPSAEIELNLTKFFRLAFGTSYRFPTPFDVGLSGTPTADAESLKGFSYIISFKFGRF